MSGQVVQLAEVSLGDTFEVGFPNSNPPRDSFRCMVTAKYADGVTVASIEVFQGRARDDSAYVTQASLELPSLRPGRMILRELPQYRGWADAHPNVLLGFAKEQPEVPTGLTLDELVRYNDSQFVLAEKPSVHEPNTAAYREPFFDYVGNQVVAQRATVFQLDDGARVERRTRESVSGEYRPVVPNGATFRRVAEGQVLMRPGGLLYLGESIYHAQMYELYIGEFFAVETLVLERAGLLATDTD